MNILITNRFKAMFSLLFLIMPLALSAQMNSDLDVAEILNSISNPQGVGNSNNTMDGLQQSPQDQDKLVRQKIDQEKEKDRVENDSKKKKILKKPRDLSAVPQPNIIVEDLKRFGSEIFDSSLSNFSPTNDIPIPPSYIIGPGDTINVTLFGTENSQYSLMVSREGDIYFPSIGPIFVTGLSYSEMKALIKDNVSSKLIGVNASVTLGKLKSIQVILVGESFQPGSYMLSALSTVTNALLTTGGISESGSHRKIEVKRGGEIITTFDLYDILLRGDTSNDIFLQSGDVIFIPPYEKTVGIAGEVKKPAIFELKSQERLRDIIDYAGGLTSSAHLASTKIERFSQNDGIQLLDVDLSNEDNFSLPLEDGDTVNVNPILNTMKDVVLLSGYAARPGFSEYKEGLRINDIIKSYDDLLPLSDRNYILIKRENSNNGRLDFYSIDIEQVLAGNKDENILLMPRDEIIVFSKETKSLLNDPINAIPDEDILEYKLEELISRCFIQKVSSQNLSTPLTNIDQLDILDPSSIESLSKQEKQSSVANNPMISPLVTREERLENERIQQKCIEDILAQYKPNPNSGRRALMLNPILQSIKDQASPNEIEKVINITGNVNFPGQYPFSKNMSVLEAIQASGGLKDTSYLDEIELIRFNNNNGYDFKIDRESISASKGTLAKQLSPGMTVHIKGAQKLNRSASISGEVYFPGTYIISEGETITDLIERAGGLKQNAFLNGVFFQRDDIKKLEEEKISSAKDLTNKEIIYQQTRVGGAADLTALLSLTDRLDTSEPTGRLVIQLNDIINGVKNDVVLRDGDQLNIPRNTQSVSVLGEVYVPTTHIYESNLIFNDYLSLSGGATKLGDPNQVFIIKANGSIQAQGQKGGFFRSSNYSIEPGDTIVVPPLIDDGGTRTLRIANDVSQLVYQLAVAAAAVNSLSN